MSIAGIGDLILLTLLLLSGMALFAPLQESWRLEKRLRESRLKLDELQVLYPIYVEISALDKPAQWAPLKVPDSQKLSGDEVPDLPARFTQLASECQLEFKAATPRLNSDDSDNSLNVEVNVSGSYDQLNQFLTSLARLPMLDSIRRLEIRREKMNEQFNILLRLALKG